MRAVFTLSARSSLLDIADYIARDNPRRALSFTQELRAAAEALAEFPEAYPVIPRYAHIGLRRRPHGHYLIFYRIVSEDVVIDHVLHGAQDYDAILFPDED